MRWEDERLSDNVQDDRGQGGGGFGGGGGGGLMIGGGGLGAVVLIGLALLFGVDPRSLLQSGDDGGGYSPSSQAAAASAWTARSGSVRRRW